MEYLNVTIFRKNATRFICKEFILMGLRRLGLWRLQWFVQTCCCKMRFNFIVFIFVFGLWTQTNVILSLMTSLIDVSTNPLIKLSLHYLLLLAARKNRSTFSYLFVKDVVVFIFVFFVVLLSTKTRKGQWMKSIRKN